MSGNDEIRMTNDDVEALLGEFAPDALEVDRDALMYRAGYNAACGLAECRSQNYFWKVTTGMMTAATVTLAAMLAEQGRPIEDQQVVTTDPRAAPAEPVAAASNPPVVAEPSTLKPPKPSPLLLADPSSNYLALRAAVLWRGVETWPTDYREPQHVAPVSQPQRTSTLRGLLEQMLPSDATSQQPADEQPTEASTYDEETIA